MHDFFAYKYVLERSFMWMQGVGGTGKRQQQGEVGATVIETQ